MALARNLTADGSDGNMLKLQGLGTYAFSIDDAGEIDEENMSDIEGDGSDSGDTERLEARRDAHAGRAEQEQRAQQGVAGPGGFLGGSESNSKATTETIKKKTATRTTKTITRTSRTTTRIHSGVTHSWLSGHQK